MSDLDLDNEWDHYQAADDAYQSAYRLGIDHGDCLDLAVDVARKPLLARIAELEANQLPDGGQWQYGIRWNYRKPECEDWFSANITREGVARYVASFEPGKAQAIRRFVGPATPIEPAARQ